MVIPKIIEGRRDKKSSFGQLIKYMADKPSQELTDTVQPTPEMALAVKSDMFEGLNNYLIRKQKVISTPVDVEPGVQRVVVGDVTCQYNTFSLDGAAQEMNSVSQQNTRCKDPVMHYVLSWPDYEKPNDDQVFDSVKFTLASMGMSDHQYVAATGIQITCMCMLLSTASIPRHIKQPHRALPKTLFIRRAAYWN